MKRGITLMEILVSISIIAILAFVGWFYLSNSMFDQALAKDKDGLISFLEEAKSAAMASKKNSNWSVIIEESQAIMFPGISYTSDDVNNKIFQFHQSVFASSTNLYGGGSTITFSRLFGKTGQFGTIIISSRNDQNKFITITVSADGVIQ